MAGADNLTPTEAKVLVELIAHQNDSDKSIAEGLGMAPSNFAVAKRRLAEKGILNEQIRINVHKVREAQVAGFVWLEYNRPIRAKFKAELDKIRSNFAVAYTFGGPDWSLNVDYFKTFDDAEDVRLRLAEYLQRKLSNYLSGYIWKVVPMSHLTSCTFQSRLLEYSITHKAREPDLNRPGSGDCCTMPQPKETMPTLNATEKRALVAMRRFPHLKKGEIAAKVGIQQSSLSEVFRQLQKKGVINYVRSVDPARVPGREMATFAWIDLKQPMPASQEKEIIGKLAEATPQLYKLHYTRTFVLANSFFKSLDKVETSRLSMLELFGDNVKSFNFKVVPCAHLTLDHTPYFMEYIYGVHFAPPGTPFHLK